MSKTRIRTALAILILSIIGLMGYNALKMRPMGDSPLTLASNNSGFKDAVGAHDKIKGPGLTLASHETEDLRDAVAANPAFGGEQNNDGPTPPPRGNGNGPGNPNGRQDIQDDHHNGGNGGSNTPPQLSPSGPTQEIPPTPQPE